MLIAVDVHNNDYMNMYANVYTLLRSNDNVLISESRIKKRPASHRVEMYNYGLESFAVYS